MTDPVQIGERTDGAPQASELLQTDVAVEPFAHVLGGQSAPDDIGEVWGDVIQCLRLQERFVGRREERETRTQAGAENPDAIETFGGQPPDRPPGIEDRLTAHLHSAGDVRAHDIVGARSLPAGSGADAERPLEKPHQYPAVHELEGRLPRAVVPAWEHHELVRNPALAELTHKIF